MKNKIIPGLLSQKSKLLVMAVCILLPGGLKAQPVTFLQLRIYSIENESQEQRMDNFLKRAYLPALHRAGISKAGVFKPKDAEMAAGSMIYVLTPFQSLEQFEKLPGILSKDMQFQSEGKDYIEAVSDNPPYRRMENILLKAFKGMQEIGMPVQSTPVSERVYELRSYQGPTEAYFQRKVEMFNEGGEMNIFKELGFNPVFFGEVISGPSMPNLMYMTSFSNEASQKEHWTAFGNHPDWKALKEVEKYKDTVSNIDKIMLQPTEYSDL